MDHFMEIAKRCAAGTPAIGYTKRDFIAEINKRAEPLRAADPKLTQEQAFARYVKGYTDGQILMKASMVAHPDPDETSATQAGTATFKNDPQGSGTAYDALMDKAKDLQKRQPGMTQEVAFAKVFADPANHALAVQERRDNRPTGQQ
jgi:hypothetical protein